MPSFVSELAADALARVGPRAALRKALGVSKQHLGRVLASKAGLGPLPLVRAARLTERDVFDVLRQGGERELADELEALLGPRLTAARQAFLDNFDHAPADIRRHLRALIKAYGEAAPAAKRPPRRPSKKAK